MWYSYYSNTGKEAAEDIADVLSHNSKLQKLYLNNLQTEGAMKIAKSLQNIAMLILIYQQQYWKRSSR